MRSRGGERGATLVEFALTALVFLTLVFGVVGFGQALFAYDLVANAARIGSRYAMVRGSACTVTGCPVSVAAVQTYVRTESPGIDTTKLTVATTWQSNAATGCSTASEAAGCIVNVAVSYPFSSVLLPKYSFTMSGASQMVISQ